jgi:Putative transcriptional regulator
LTTSRDILEAIAIGEGPNQYLVALGYAGWGEGQLEREIVDNAWLNTPCGNDILFNTPVNQRWQAAAHQIGIDINQLTTPAGHG